jgi:uroporphyrinogen decarboxylase
MADRFLSALAGKNQGRPPVWLMRQAGRFLPEYRALRQKYSLRDLFFTPALASEVTLMPVKRFGVDAAILFSDITAIAPAMGLKLSFNEGPILENWVEPHRLDELRFDLEALTPIFETVRLVKQQTSTPLIGFCGGPFTVATYFVEGNDLSHWMKKDPESFTSFLDRICDVSIAYLKGQIEAGADAIQIFDSWANLLEGDAFHSYSLHYLKRIVEAIEVPTIVFMRGSALRAEALAETGAHCVSVDWERPLSDIRKTVSCSLQGNLNPDLLFQPVDQVRQEAKRLLSEMKGDPSFIFNLGHGVKVGTPVESVAALIETIQCS